jgi:hypothetical protein
MTCVKKSGLSERSEFPDFSRATGFLGNYLQRRRFSCLSGQAGGYFFALQQKSYKSG